MLPVRISEMMSGSGSSGSERTVVCSLAIVPLKLMVM